MFSYFTNLWRWICVAVALPLLVGCGGDDGGSDNGPVVLAASSLQEALGEAAAVWAERGHEAPVLSFAASSALARQIENGAPVDIFISADEAWMDHVEGRGELRVGSRASLASNRLVMIAQPGSSIVRWDGTGEDLTSALGQHGRLAMADPTAVPAGRYAKAALEHLNLWDTVSGRIAEAENVRAALALVQRGQAPLGIVYASDASAAGLPAIWSFPKASHPPIRYPVAVLATSNHVDSAELYAFLLSPEARAIFERHGFGPGA